MEEAHGMTLFQDTTHEVVDAEQFFSERVWCLLSRATLPGRDREIRDLICSKSKINDLSCATMSLVG